MFIKESFNFKVVPWKPFEKKTMLEKGSLTTRLAFAVLWQCLHDWDLQWISGCLKNWNNQIARHYPKKFYLLRSNINQKLLFDSTISGTRTYRCCRLGLIAIKHTSFRIIIPVKVLWKYSRTHLEESIPPYIKIHIPTLFLFLSGKLYSSLI